MNDSLDAQKGTTAQNSTTKPIRRRRHEYSPEIADLICDRIAGGASLRQICQDANMPARSTIFVWLEEHEEFARSYTLARQIQIEDLMDEILEIAAACSTLTVFDGPSCGLGLVSGYLEANAEEIPGEPILRRNQR